MTYEYTIETLGPDGLWIGPRRFFATEDTMIRKARKIHKSEGGERSRIWGSVGNAYMVLHRLIGERGHQTLYRF